MFIKPVQARYQVTVPQEVREELGVTVGDKLVFVKSEGGYLVKKFTPEMETVVNHFLLTDTQEAYVISKVTHTDKSDGKE